MRTILIALVTIFAGHAMAADMPVKVQPRQFISAYPYETGGFYFGVGTFAETEKVNVPLANTFAAGASVTGSIGYTKPLSANSWVAIEGQIAYANTGTNNMCAAGGAFCSVNTKFSGELLAKYGGNLDSLGGIIPGIGNVFPTLPTIPTGQNPTVHPYIGAGVIFANDQLTSNGVDSKKMHARGVGRVGFLTQKDNGTVIDTWAEWSPKSGSALALPNFQADVGDRYRVGLSVFWGLTK